MMVAIVGQSKPDQPRPSIGWVGLGDQGRPLVARLAAAGYDVTVWARRPETYAAMADVPTRIAPTLVDLGRRCDVVGICVMADRDVVEVVVESGMLSVMRHGSAIIVHSTVLPATCRDLAREAGARGVDVIDAPITRDRAVQEDAEFTVLVGGEERVVDRLRPVLLSYAAHVLHLGPIGAGQTLKVINNTMFTAHLELLGEALNVGSSLGLRRQAMLDALAMASGATTAMKFLHFYEPLPRADYAATLAKDVAAFERLSPDSELAPHLQSVAASMIDGLMRRVERGFGQ